MRNPTHQTPHKSDASVPAINRSTAASRPGLRVCTALALGIAGAAFALGANAGDLAAPDARAVVAFASYTDPAYAAATRERLQSAFATPVVVNQVTVNGVAYLRLQSTPVQRSTATVWMEQANATGYNAWLVSADASLNPPTERAAASVDRADTAASERLANLSVPAVPEALLLSDANPELVNQLPEGPLLGDLFPPRAPLPPGN